MNKIKIRSLLASCFNETLLFSTLSYDNQSSTVGFSTSVNSVVLLPIIVY